MSEAATRLEACAAAVSELFRTGTVRSATIARLVALGVSADLPVAAPGRPYGRRSIFHDAGLGEVMIATWRAGARSAPHDHGGAPGLVAVLSGTFEERVHVRDGAGLGPMHHAFNWSSGDAIAVPAERVHDMTCRGDGGVTLHIYAGVVGPSRLYDVTRRETVLATGGAWLPSDEVVLVEPWEPKK